MIVMPSSLSSRYSSAGEVCLLPAGFRWFVWRPLHPELADRRTFTLLPLLCRDHEADAA